MISVLRRGRILAIPLAKIGLRRIVTRNRSSVSSRSATSSATRSERRKAPPRARHHARKAVAPIGRARGGGHVLPREGGGAVDIGGRERWQLLGAKRPNDDGVHGIVYRDFYG